MYSDNNKDDDILHHHYIVRKQRYNPDFRVRGKEARRLAKTVSGNPTIGLCCQPIYPLTYTRSGNHIAQPQCPVLKEMCPFQLPRITNSGMQRHKDNENSNLLLLLLLLLYLPLLLLLTLSLVMLITMLSYEGCRSYEMRLWLGCEVYQ